MTMVYSSRRTASSLGAQYAISACTSVPGSFSRPFEERQLDHEERADDLATEAFDELDLRLRRSARREHVVQDDHPCALLERIGVDLERVAAVLELVGRTDLLPGELAGLAGRHEAAAELVRERAAEDEAARLRAEDHVRPTRPRPVSEVPDGRVERLAVADQRHQVLEHDPLAAGSPARRAREP